MKNRKAAQRKHDLLRDQYATSPGRKELARSHRILKRLTALIPAKGRDEFVRLLHTLEKADGATGEPAKLAKAQYKDELSEDRCRILQIVAQACTSATSDKNFSAHEPDRRISERRKGDRRKQQLISNHGKPWKPEQIEALRTLARQNTPIRRIALKLGRTSTAINLKAKEINLPLSLII